MEDKFEKRTNCLYCEKEMDAKYRNKKFCSDKCRVYFSREEKYSNVVSEINPKLGDIVKLNEQFKIVEIPKTSGIDFENRNKNYNGSPPDIDTYKKNMPLDNSEILKKIAEIKAEKIPKERDTPLGRKVWNNERAKKIKELESKLTAQC